MGLLTSAGKFILGRRLSSIDHFSKNPLGEMNFHDAFVEKDIMTLKKQLLSLQIIIFINCLEKL